ncbi:MAG: LSU ribosomal protein L35p, partial [uncultured Acidimicrobiales bacterium]
AEDEDRQGRRQALQGHRHRQDHAPQGLPLPHPREEVERAHPPAGQGARGQPGRPPPGQADAGPL